MRAYTPRRSLRVVDGHHDADVAPLGDLFEQKDRVAVGVDSTPEIVGDIPGEFRFSPRLIDEVEHHLNASSARPETHHSGRAGGVGDHMYCIMLGPIL